ncbi:MAG: GAF domain-containing protein [Comamonadaceae bacterium]|nr:MAG: GAF domain-containing protein [Comamonadaceae bacterium]
MDAVLSLAHQLARILAEVHRAGVIHGDISPANILVSPAFNAVLIDFDLAALAAQQLEAGTDRQVAGTLGYMAPEQTGRTGRAVDQRADLYSLGATLYELATGHPPFERADALQLIHDHLVREPVAPRDADARIPDGLSDIIVRLLAKAPEQRYQSAEGLLHDLERLRSGLEQGRNEAFELGEWDFAARLSAPMQLVGRDAERSVLLNTFAEAMHTPRRTVLVGGPAGVGKSALINELRPVVAAGSGWFAYGKFHQYQRDASTAGALTQVLRALGHLLLTQTGDEMVAQRTRIMQALGRNAGLITRASPEFALLLGPQPEVPGLDPREVELQGQLAMLDLLGAIATPACPLVLIFDDLQWGEAHSLRLFERIMVELDVPGLLLVGAYRSEEVGAGHPLAPMLARWQQHAHPPAQIALANLSLHGMSEMTRLMLRLSPERSFELAQALNVLTRGNPFDTVEMINALRGDGVLSLGQSAWQWDEDKVRRFIGRGNVVDLLAARIARLPAATRSLLQSMSCLGNMVGCLLLGAATGLREDELRMRLQPALDDGLLLEEQPGGQESLRFRHDRVQQAILGEMDEPQRGGLQLDMARRLAANATFEHDAAHQYLASVDLLDEPLEQRQAAHMFFRLAQVLASTATHALAERYLAAAGALLAAVDDPVDAAHRRAIDVARHRALYSLGSVKEADPLYARIEASALDPLDLIEPTCLHMRFLDIQGRSRDALAMASSLLAKLGVHVPDDYSEPDMEQWIDTMADWVRRDSLVDYSKRPVTQDQRLVGIYKALNRMAASAFHSKEFNALAWVHLQATSLWNQYGPSESLIACQGGLGVLLISMRQDYKTAYAISRHLIAVSEALGFEARTAGLHFTASLGASTWMKPLEEVLADVTHAAEVFQLKGDDASHACYFSSFRYIALLEVAPTLDTCESEIETGLLRCRRTGNLHAAALHTFERQFVRALRGLTIAPDSFGDDDFDEKKFLATMGFQSHIHDGYIQYRGFQSMIWGDVGRLAIYAPPSGEAAPARVNVGLYRTMFAYLFAALARAWQVQQGDPASAEAAPMLAELELHRCWFEERAADQPHNFLHLYRLVEAEQAWAVGDLWKAAVTFDAAVLEAESRQRPWHRALIAERAGRFNLARGLVGAGRFLLVRARDHYRAWGAQAKVDQMHRDHPFLQSPSRKGSAARTGNKPDQFIKGSNSVSADDLDLVGVLRASQALSSETSLERLTARVSEVLASLSGATRVLVLSCNEGQWSLLSHASALPSMPVAEAAQLGLLPLSAFAYAERTGEPLIVNDAAADDRFARDPYFAGVPVCSLLLVPIAGQGAARGMLVLENRLGRAAFNALRLDAVILIAGQLAVSLANAQLYESLEQRVYARTRELREAQAELVTTARRAGMAEVANNVLHNVGNVLNSINVSARVMRGNIGNSRMDGLARAVALINEHQHDLPRFIETDPRGKALWPYLNRLVEALRAERDELLGDLDRLSLSVDHVTYVVSTQQSHAGPSSLREMARPQELIEQALQLSGGVLDRCRIAVVRQYEEVPVSALDSQRLVQILVNLIGNAAQAMEGAPADRRQLVLGVSLLNGAGPDAGGGKRLRITVRDAGEGIAPENISRIFSHGFTTRTSGHGFGLHSSAVAATEMGGALTVHSEGPGRGAIFTIDLPLRT